MSDPKAILALRPFTVRELKWETENTFTLVLVPEPGGEMFSFKAGQWVYLHLLNPDGSSWARAAFSVASAPEESKESFELGIKIYGDFTKKASNLIPDDKVVIQGPFGVFTLRENMTPLVMFAGGIGVTPFRSMIRTLWKQNANVDIFLFYSNREVEEVAYWEEFEKIAEEWPRFHPIFILTGIDIPSTWKGETGRLDTAMINRYYKDFSQGDFVMCGPPGFMDTVKALLDAEGVDTKTRLRKELFG